MTAEKMKKILFTSSAPHVAGGEINLLALLDTIGTERFCPYCLYQPSSHFETYGLRNDVSLIPFSFPEFAPKNFFKVTGALIKLFFLVVRYRIDLIYINVIADYKLVQLVSKIFGIPVMLHIHVDEPDESLRWVQAQFAARILFPSKATMTAVLKHSSWLDASKCFYVHNAVDLQKYCVKPIHELRRELHLLDDGLPVIGIIGQLKEIKGQHFFLEMAKQLSNQGIKAHYLIVGEDNTRSGRYRQWLQADVRAGGLQDVVRFLGFRSDIPELMSLCDLLVVPSLHEPFGRVVIEAMACGTPVVASAVGGIVEIFEEGKGGLFFQPGNVEELTSKVMYFIEHPDWWQEQKKIAVEVCSKRFCQETHTRSIEEHIASVLEDNGSR